MGVVIDVRERSIEWERRGENREERKGEMRDQREDRKADEII